MQSLDAREFDWYLIANPTAMGGRAKKRFEHIKDLFNSKGWSVEWAETEYAGHAMTLAADGYEQGFRHFIALGGDGTAHELINGLAQTRPNWEELYFTLLPAGTGNDWIKNWDISAHPEEWMHQMQSAQCSRIYPADVRYEDEDGTIQDRHFFNALSLGFGGEVMYRLSRADSREPHWIVTTFIHWINAVLGGLSGGLIPPIELSRGSRSKWSYFTTLLGSLVSYRSKQVTIHSEEGSRDISLYTLEFCKGRYLGGGMFLGPHADPTSAPLAVTEAKNLNAFRVLLSLPKLYNGKVCEHRNIRCYHSSTIRVEPARDEKIKVEADGEYLGLAPVRIGTSSIHINFMHS